MKTKIILIAFIILAASAASFSQTPGPADTVAAFYKYSNARSSTFNNRHIESRKQWYTPALYNLFLLELKKEKAMLKAHPDDKPFFGDGLTFRPTDEPCEANGKSYKRTQSIGRVSTGKNRSYVDVKFAYPKACKSEPVSYRVNLQKIKGKWLISDWTYSSGMTLTRKMRENKY
jgi:hypothetical protein